MFYDAVGQKFVMDVIVMVGGIVGMVGKVYQFGDFVLFGHGNNLLHRLGITAPVELLQRAVGELAAVDHHIDRFGKIEEFDPAPYVAQDIIGSPLAETRFGEVQKVVRTAESLDNLAADIAASADDQYVFPFFYHYPLLHKMSVR